MSKMTELPTHYYSKSGKKLVPIASMMYSHLAATAKKWRMEDGDPFMQQALDERLAYLDGLPDDAARISATSPVAPAGHNLPSVEIKPKRTRDQIQAWINDLYDQARDILDGQPIANEGQAELVAKLKAMIVEAENEADELRKAEARPHDDAKKAIQDFYNPLIADNKATQGLTVRATKACQALLTPWLVKVANELEAKKEAARADTDAAVANSQTLAQAADMTSIGDVEVVEAAVQGAREAIRIEKAVEKERPRVDTGGFGRGTLLRDNWVATLDPGDDAFDDALTWAVKYHRAEIETHLRMLAGASVKTTKGAPIPGFTVTNERRAA